MITLWRLSKEVTFCCYRTIYSDKNCFPTCILFHLNMRIWNASEKKMAAAGSMKKWQMEKLRNQNISLWATASLEANFLSQISGSFHAVYPGLRFLLCPLASQGQSSMVRLTRSLSSHFYWHTCPIYFSKNYIIFWTSVCAMALTNWTNLQEGHRPHS